MWDFFNVRWSENGGRATGAKAGRLSPWSGRCPMPPPSHRVEEAGEELCATTDSHLIEKFALAVQGCDDTGGSRLASGRALWSVPVSAVVTR